MLKSNFKFIKKDSQTIFIVNEYLNGKSLTEISKELNLNPPFILRRLRIMGVKCRSISESTKLGMKNSKFKFIEKDELTENLIKDYLNLYSINELSKKYNLNIPFIKRRFKKFNVKIRDFRESYNIVLNKKRERLNVCSQDL